MNKIEQIFENVLSRIKPTNVEILLIQNIVQELKTLIKTRAEQLNIKFTTICPQGSTGIKQTQLKTDFDIDLFIGLNYEEFKSKYDGISKTRAKKAIKKDFFYLCENWIIQALHGTKFKDPVLFFAEHPYVRVNYFHDGKKIKIDIVLYFDLPKEYIMNNGPITAVDRTPWHGKFIKENLTERQKDEVRLLKQFFKACYCYGDKSPIGRCGFIGYSAELLIHHFKSLQNLFENFNSLKNMAIDPIKRRTYDQLKKIERFKDDFLIIIDPVDPNRNVGSSISKRAYDYCNVKVKEFLKNPKEAFFEIRSIPEFNPKTSKKSTIDKLFIIEFKNEDPDVHYTINRDKLYSLGQSIKANGEKEYTHAKKFGRIEFEVYFEEEQEEYNIALYCDEPIIPRTYLRKGPPINSRYHAKKFMEKNPNYIIKDGYLWVEDLHSHVNFLDFLKDFVPEKSPKNLKLLNISDAKNCITSPGKKALYLLDELILPLVLF